MESLWIERQARLQQNVQLLRLQALPLDLKETIRGLCERWLYGEQAIGRDASEVEGLRETHEAFALSSVQVRSDYEEVERRAESLTTIGHYATEEITDLVAELEEVVLAFVKQVSDINILKCFSDPRQVEKYLVWTMYRAALLFSNVFSTAD